MAGFIDGFVQGAADQATGILNSQMQDDRQRAYAQFQAELQDKKERSIAKLRQEMADAPLNRVGAKAKEFAGQEVPLEAEQPAPVTKTGGILSAGDMTGVDGRPIQAQGGNDRGLVTGQPGGSQTIEEMKANVLKDPSISDEDKRGVIAQLDAQAAQENQKNMADANLSVAGKTRKRTADEALSMAADDAKINDLPGYAAYESTIGKTKREERKVESQDRKDDIREKKNDSDAADRKARADWLQTHQRERLELDKEIARQRMEKGSADDKDPADVRTTKFLAAYKDDQVMMDAWEKANRTKSKDIKGIAADLMAKNPTLEADEAVAKAKALVAASEGGKESQGKPVPAKKDQLVAGEVYNTARGMAKWNGTAFEKTK